MARYLVVAHQTVTSPELLKVVRGVRDQATEAEFVLLVPATPVRHLLFRKGDEHDAEATARKRGERARAVFTKKGVPLSDVHVGGRPGGGDRPGGRRAPGLVLQRHSRRVVGG